MNYNWMGSIIVILVAGCGIPVTQSPEPLKIFATSEEYLQEGKKLFDSNRFVDSQRYVMEAIRLDPNNQAAHLLAGVTWAKVGKGIWARREFEKAFELDRNSGDGVTARSWIERLSRPLNVAIFPIENLRGASAYGVERSTYQSLQRQLLESGLYSIVDERQLGFLGYGQSSRQIQACQLARGKGARIAILGAVTEFQLVRDSHPIIDLRGQAAIYYAAALKVTLQIYAVTDCRLVETPTKAMVRRQIPDRERDAALHLLVDSVAQQLALNIHAALM